ncbi:MFS transporter [Actinomycetaceae bacterium L2_0104]
MKDAGTAEAAKNGRSGARRRSSSGNGRKALTVWLAAQAVYIIAVAGRSSFGVAGLQAMDRFEIPAATLSLFTVVQLGVYSLAQIPVGILLDRIGVRKVIAGGALVMATGQIALGLADDLTLALSARILIGLGDAAAFTSVIRLIPAWFTPGAASMMTQLTGVTGQLGQVISSFPFAWALREYGWQSAFIALGAAGVLAGLLAWVGVRDWPVRRKRQETPDVAAEIPSLISTVKEPGAWLGFWTHYVGGFPAMVFMLIWGVPFLQIANGMSAGLAAGIIVIQPLAGIVTGPLIGRLTGLHPLRRTWLVYTAAVLTIVAWLPLLLRDGPAPLWVIIVLLCVLSLSASASAIAFDFVRTSVHPARAGIANGLANMGGFSATLLTAWIIGLALDRFATNDIYTAGDYRAAMALQGAVMAVGLAGVALSKRATRRRMAERGTVVPPIRDVIKRYRDGQ